MPHPFLSAYFRYIDKSIAEKSSASSPPAPEIIVSMALPLSYFPKPSFLFFSSASSRSTARALTLSFQKSGSAIPSSSFLLCSSISCVSSGIIFVISQTMHFCKSYIHPELTLSKIKHICYTYRNRSVKKNEQRLYTSPKVFYCECI